jgi:hypothetical protein
MPSGRQAYSLAERGQIALRHKLTIAKLQHDRSGPSSERARSLDQLELQLGEFIEHVTQTAAVDAIAAAQSQASQPDDQHAPSSKPRRRMRARRPLLSTPEKKAPDVGAFLLFWRLQSWVAASGGASAHLAGGNRHGHALADQAPGHRVAVGVDLDGAIVGTPGHARLGRARKQLIAIDEIVQRQGRPNSRAHAQVRAGRP